ncbi:hypothetical protein TWF106_009184 [Orbilia oligospora]|uniref:Uncharacterized protein n=1 Tax=Orbilia oligospora TaxID=2813651 RepID=A0A6G1LYJ0_ORBOL|nr:hypothetical protein TWF788_008990 [Orbilia oligospora]KAF3209954.1 hypothetical protein TWF679_007177 [Orbilia oligospora]KAF3224112.1 hypothetical protein TWF191_006228 [Orbilia oligospora]KAF3227675.1 hypothetical protein TWF106_009184 [Orbilia oligospora]KAF3238938.1 hypothetical protein TWF192_010215 [Orbilia oligospora]
MAQGTKKLTKPTTTKRPQTLGPRKGNRVIAPKKQILIKQNAIKKKHSGGLTAKTEKNLAEKAGHLELLPGGKKDKKK